MVALDKKLVAYFLVNYMPTTLSISEDSEKTKLKFNDFPIELVLNEKEWIKKYTGITDTLENKTSKRQGIGGKITNEDVRIIKRRIMSGEKQKDIAKDFNISEQSISNIKKERSWKHIKI